MVVTVSVVPEMAQDEAAFTVEVKGLDVDDPDP
jgi:hypothetical protein